MTYNYYLFLLLLIVTACNLYIAVLAWRRRENTVAFCFFFGLLASALYTFGYAFEIMSTDLEQIKFWLKIEYIGISFGVLLWFFTIALYTNSKIFLRKWVFYIMAIVPIITFISHYTNDWHHLFYRDMEMTETMGFLLVSTTAGPFYMLHTVYNYLLVLIGMALLVNMLVNVQAHLKKQVILMLIGSCGPFGITIIYLSGVLKPLDISPIGFLFSGVFFMWGIYQFNMLNLVPYALKKVFESMKDAVIVLDLDNTISSFNLSAKQIFPELQDKKVLGQEVVPFLSKYPELSEMIEAGFVKHQKIKLQKQQNTNYYHVYISDVLDKKQNPVGRMLMLSDITETVLAEERLISSAQQLSELNAFKDKMFTVIAHDIRDPLSILMNLAEIQRDELEVRGEKQDDVTEEMEKQIRNTFTLVEGLLDWFRSQKGGMTFNPVSWNLAKAFKSNMDLLRIQRERKQINMIMEIPEDLVILADKEMLDLIIRNILSNAIKFTDHNGTIRIKAENSDGKAVVAISDTGKGILPDKARTLLQDEEIPTSSLGTAGERGIGLGLSLCKHFVQVNGGKMWFESVPDLGSTFYFSIPIPTDG
ncbi:sensor histidine kinase [Ornithinibacillus contaminans]|uniref:sensor histidine kinase n=1 Tax=Ornithinibacillus contaminans TaxID=694055 RepID=UPI00064DD214|nr:histidine kinase N-terminal 7TM domain-containing protein [Ornithinibacillus contaminans]